ncbi:MAG: putative repeat protein (TIGR01451 family), partial [Myxococcota bacterium]
PGGMPCTNSSASFRLRVSVSHVDADNLVAWATLPGDLQYQSADGGSYTASATTIAGVAVPANSVYFNLGTVPSGNTFIKSFVVRSPNGVVHGTSYDLQMRLSAANAEAVISNVASFSVQSKVQALLSKGASGTFRINGKNYINSGSSITYSLRSDNFRSPSGTTCGETIRDGVVIDDLSAFFPGADGPYLADPPGVTNISAGGTFTGSSYACAYGTLDNSTTPPTCLGGVLVPPNAVFWEAGDYTPRSGKSYSFTLELADDTVLDQDQDILNTARVSSAAASVAPGSATSATASYPITIGIPNNPNGTYAKGDSIRGRRRVSSGQDNADRTVGYGDPVTFLLYATNRGASALNETWLVDKIPLDTTFSSAFVPGGDQNTTYYQTCSTFTDPMACATASPSSPPDWDESTGQVGSTWTTTAPANPSSVRWVAFHVPKLASPFFPEAGFSSQTTAEVNIVVDQPTGACAEFSISNLGLFRTYDYTPVGDTASVGVCSQGSENCTAGSNAYLSLDNVELVTVIPTTPGLSSTRISASPSTRIGAGPVTFTVNVPNTKNGSAVVDTALDVEAVISLPTATINGVNQPLPFVGVDASGGSVDYSDLPNSLTVTWPTIAPEASKQVRIGFDVPKGMLNSTRLSMSASVSGFDDACGAVSATASGSATVLGDPILQVSKSVDFDVAGGGTVLDYKLLYENRGDGVSTGTWIVDQIPSGTQSLSASAPLGGGKVYFSSAQPPTLPAALRDGDFDFTQAVILATFTEGTLSNGEYTSPFGPATTYVAFLVDDASLTPPQFITGAARSVTLRVEVDPSAVEGSLAVNEALIFSSELLGAISNQVRTFVSPSPSVSVGRECVGVVASQETFDYALEYRNNSTNNDDVLVLTETLPAGLSFVSAVHTFDGALYPGVDVPAAVDGQTVTFDVTAAIGGPLNSLEGGRIRVTVTVDDDVPSQRVLEIGGLAFANNASVSAGVTIFTSCNVLVENADMWLRKAVDLEEPVSGETVTYTLLITNRGANSAENVDLTDMLPSNMTYVAGSAFVASPGWRLGGYVCVTAGCDLTDPMQRTFVTDSEPATLAGGLVWSAGTGNALTRQPADAGFVPGGSGDIVLTFRAQVNDDVDPDTIITNTALVTTTTSEDENFENRASADVRVPFPDPYLEKRAPSLAQPGGTVSYQIRYGNNTRQPAQDVVIIDRLYDDPL